MSDSQLSEHDLFRKALAAQDDCPEIETLELALSRDASAMPTELAQHLNSCSYCQAELHLLRNFHEDGVKEDSEKTRKVVALLQERSKEILRPYRPAEVAQGRWWNRAFQFRWLSPAVLGMAALAVVAGVVLQYRQAGPQPAVNRPLQTGSEVFRTSGFAVVKPAGDLAERPQEIRWELVQAAAKYRVRLLEVDGTEIWTAESAAGHIDLPGAVQARIVPAKTLFCEVVAFDSSDRKLGETGLVRFRLLLNGGRR